jgi:hypothetical protein
VGKILTGARGTCFGLCMLALAAGCASSTKASGAPTTAAEATTSANPDLTPNSIPYVVGERIGLPNNWLVTVTKVHRPYSQTGLPSLPSGQQYVAVDVKMEYEGTESETVKAADLFTMVDGNQQLHAVVKAPTPNGVDGAYKQGTTHVGRLVYAVPPKVRLVLAMDGPKIGTQRSIFTIDPPTVPAD